MTFLEKRKLQVEIDEICAAASLVTNVLLATTNAALLAKCEARLEELEEEFRVLEERLHQVDGKIFALDPISREVKRVKSSKFIPLPP